MHDGSEYTHGRKMKEVKARQRESAIFCIWFFRYMEQKGCSFNFLYPLFNI